MVGAAVSREELLARGIPSERIQVLGIPIDPKFSKPLNREQLQQRLGLDPKLFTVLICSGGFGTGPIAESVLALSKIATPLQLLVVTGKNSALLRQLEAKQAQIPHRLKLYGFADNMEELMTLADLMVTKPGGLSCTEAIAKGLPLLLVSPIPGQETRNAKILIKEGIAVRVPRLQEFPKLLEQLRNDPAQLAEMARRGKQFSLPDAAFSIARLALSS